MNTAKEATTNKNRRKNNEWNKRQIKKNHCKHYDCIWNQFFLYICKRYIKSFFFQQIHKQIERTTTTKNGGKPEQMNGAANMEASVKIYRIWENPQSLL